MTLPEQPSALSKEELEGLLGSSIQREGDDRDKHTSAERTVEKTPAATGLPETAAASESGVETSGTAMTEHAQSPSAVEENSDDLRMVLGHWERTVASLQQELIELRSRVSRLEQQLDQASDAQQQQQQQRSQAADKPSAAADTAGMEEAPSALSRVRTYRSKRGWF